MEIFSRTAMLIGEEALQKLGSSHVAVFGVGGVGGNCIEALARSNIGTFSLFDHDVISLSNINRQVIALHSTVGKKKVEVMKERIKDINPKAEIHAYPAFVNVENIDEIDFSQFDYIVDAVDTVSAKLLLIEKAKHFSIPIISSMGTGNKLHPERLEIMDISKTKYCPLAKVMRRELKKRGIAHLKVCSSYEEPIKPGQVEMSETGKMIPGSVSFVPSVAGIQIAKEVILDLIEK